MRATIVIAGLGLALGVAGGCKRTASDYCDSDNTECPSGSFCNTDLRTCIEMVDGAVTSCHTPAECLDPAYPACFGDVCTECEPGDPGDNCADNDYPGCAADGTCSIACADDSDCSMGSGVCLADGKCAHEAEVIYTTPGGPIDPSTCSKADPCDLEYGVGLIDGTRHIVHLINATYDTLLGELTPGADAIFVGRDATIRYNSSVGADGSVFHVTGGHRIEIDFIVLRDGTGTTGAAGNGVYCDGGATLVSTGMRAFSNDNHGISTALCTVDLTDVEIDGNDDVGITINDELATLAIDGAEIHTNVGSGIHVITGSATVRRAVIRNNFGGGLELSDKASVVENCIIAHNGSGSSNYGGIRFGPTPDHVFRFNTVSANLDSNPGALRTGMQCNAQVNGVANILDDDLQEGTCINDNSVFTENASTRSGAAQVTATQVELFANVDMPGNANYYRLNTGCPAVNAAGVGAPVADVTVDIDGQPRPVGNASDSGADEVQ